LIQVRQDQDSSGEIDEYFCVEEALEVKHQQDQAEAAD
jgi:hypothetical protein